MKKYLLTLLICLFSFVGFSQKLKGDYITNQLDVVTPYGITTYDQSRALVTVDFDDSIGTVILSEYNGTKWDSIVISISHVYTMPAQEREKVYKFSGVYMGSNCRVGLLYKDDKLEELSIKKEDDLIIFVFKIVEEGEL